MEESFKAGYHCRWHKEQGAYCFDPAMSPGDPDGAFEAWLRWRDARSPAPEALRELIARWREADTDGHAHDPAVAWAEARLQCADELEALLLSSQTPPAPGGGRDDTDR